MLVSYNIYVNRLLFQNENSIILCKQSVADKCIVCERNKNVCALCRLWRQTAERRAAIHVSPFASLNNPLDCSVPRHRRSPSASLHLPLAARRSRPVHNGRGASGLKPTTSAPLFTVPPPRFIRTAGARLPLGSQWSRCVGAEARSCRSLVHRSSASLHPAQRALGFVMLQVKRFPKVKMSSQCCRANQRKPGRVVIHQNLTKRNPLQLQGISFCWIPAGGVERPQCGIKRNGSPVSQESCKRQ